MYCKLSWLQRIYFAFSATALFLSHWAVEPASAVDRIYNLVTSQSSIALSGSATTSLGTAPIQQQGPGSLVTSYSGAIRTVRGSDTISFTLGSNINANVSGNWQPLPDGSPGSALADYGGRISYFFGTVNVDVAGRNLIAGLASRTLAVNQQGNFDLSTISLTLADGNVAYRSGIGGQSGSTSIAGESGLLDGTGSLATSPLGQNLLETLTIPIDTSIFVPIDANTSVNLVMTGQLVATAILPIELPGDYNDNGIVDAADYVVWRGNLGSGVSLPHDGSPGVGSDDYDRWQANFGASQGGASSLPAAVPEPTGIASIALMAGVAMLFWRKA